MAAKTLEAQNPLILRCNRLMEAFAKSDDERDFYLDRLEGFIVYVDLDKTEEDLEILKKELLGQRFCMIPKLTFYETKKIMEGFINEKVYDIDTKEKLLDIIQSKEARENFLEFIYDHHTELEKWQVFYQERSRIRIIEWLRLNHFQFVFEEDLEFPRILLEKLKKELFQSKVGKDVLAARKMIVAKSKTYYSNEALNPRPKRGRPPKQIQKLEVEPQITTDIYTTVPAAVRGFLFTPDITSSSSTFSSRFGNEEDLFASRSDSDNIAMANLNQKLAELRLLSSKWKDEEGDKKKSSKPNSNHSIHPLEADEDDDEIELDFDEDEEVETKVNKMKSKATGKTSTSNKGTTAALKKAPAKKNLRTLPKINKIKTASKAAPKKAVPLPKIKPIKQVKKVAPKKKPETKAIPTKKIKNLRPIKKLKKKR